MNTKKIPRTEDITSKMEDIPTVNYTKAIEVQGLLEDATAHFEDIKDRVRMMREIDADDGFDTRHPILGSSIGEQRARLKGVLITIQLDSIRDSAEGLNSNMGKVYGSISEMVELIPVEKAKKVLSSDKETN